MNAKIAILVVVSGIALGIIAFAVLRPDRRTKAVPVKLEIKEKKLSPRETDLATARSLEAMTAAAAAVAPPLPPPVPAVRIEQLNITPTLAGAARKEKGSVEFTIQDGKSHDFSPGRPVISETEQDKAAMEAAMREIELATKDMTLPPAKPVGGGQ